MQVQSQSKIDVNSNMFGGFSMKSDPQEQKSKNTPNFTIQVESGFLNNDYELSSKVDLFVKLFLENQNFKTPISVDCGKNPTWGKEATYPFFESQLVEKNYQMKFELWNYETELGDLLLGQGQLDIMESFSNSLKQIKIPLYHSQRNQQQIGYLIATIRFAYNFIGKITKDPPVIFVLILNNQYQLLCNLKKKRYGQPLKFSKPVTIEGHIVKKSEIEERQISFEERMKNLKEKYNIQPSKKEDLKFEGIEISYEVKKAVQEGLVLIGKNRQNNNFNTLKIIIGQKQQNNNRPNNPVRELGAFLVNYKGDSQNQ